MITLNGIVKVIILILTKAKYVLTVEFQRNRTEGDFGIYQQLSRGNYHTVLQQVLNSLTFQRLKTF